MSPSERPDWWKRAVVYQIYPKSFRDGNGDGVGDIRGIIEKLPYLKDLGVGVAWLSPIFASPMIDNGYDTSDYCAVNPLFGTMADAEELFAEAKKRDIRIVLDIALNHTSTQHPWFKDALAHGEKRDWSWWRDAILNDLAKAHPDIRECVSRIDVMGPPRRVPSSFVKGYEYLPVIIPARN